MRKISVSLCSLLTFIALLLAVNSAQADAIDELELKGNYIESYFYNVYPQGSHCGVSDVWQITVIYQNYVLTSIEYVKLVDNGANTTQSDAEAVFDEPPTIGTCKRNIKYCPKT
ncbi:MAG: hypothetical protein HRT35_12785 [Algicola sp.]|nr:hypothetical protein [Algicola sp.]